MQKTLKTIVLLVIVGIAFSCQDEDKDSFTACGAIDPAENVSWMKTLIESWQANSTIYEYMYIQQGTYLGQTVFIAGNCCPFCGSYFPIFNCEGDELTGISVHDISGLQTIWKPFGSKCTF
jgi:hypothetical protein